jgi:hypothetical protein
MVARYWMMDDGTKTEAKSTSGAPYSLSYGPVSGTKYHGGI